MDGRNIYNYVNGSNTHNDVNGWDTYNGVHGWKRPTGNDDLLIHDMKHPVKHEGHIKTKHGSSNQNKSHSLFTTHSTSCLKRILTNEVEWTEKAEIRQAYFVAAGKSRQSCLVTCSGLKRDILSSGFSAEDTFVSASVAHHCEYIWWS